MITYLECNLTEDKNIRLKNGKKFMLPAGALVQLLPNKETALLCDVRLFDENGEVVKFSATWQSALTLFNVGVEIPKLDDLNRWVWDSVCDSVAGEQVEPDGWDSNGYPSWLLALGMI